MRRLELSASSVLHTARSLRLPRLMRSSDIQQTQRDTLSTEYLRSSGEGGKGRFTNINNIFASQMFMLQLPVYISV